MGKDEATLRQLVREARPEASGKRHGRGQGPFCVIDRGKISRVGCGTYLSCVLTIRLEGNMSGSARSCNDLEELGRSGSPKGSW